MKSVTRVAVAALLFLSSSLAHATSVVALDDEGLVRNSSIIGVAQVLRTHTESSDRGVFTIAELQFYQGLKGVQANDVVAVQIPGGPMGNGMVMRVSGAPQMKTGQLFLTFLHEHGGVFKTTAMSLGVMPIVIDANGVSRVLQRTDGLAFVSPDGGVVPPRVRVNNQPLNDVLDHFRGIVDRQGATPSDPTDPGVGSGVTR